MKTEENLYRIPYMREFDYVCDLNNIHGLLLDNIEVYTLNSTEIEHKVAFDIVVNSEEKYILPRCNPKKHNYFLLKAERLVYGRVQNDGNNTIILASKLSD